MADDLSPTQTSASTAPSKGESRSDKLADLRDLAQQHLEKIDDESKLEEIHEKKRLAELENESVRKCQSRKQQQLSHVVLDEERQRKRVRMRTAQDVLDRLRWDPSFDLAHYVIGYLDRFGGILELRVNQWIKESTDEEWIPQHRIRYFKKTPTDPSMDREGEIVWHRDERIDRVFGST